MYGVCFEEVMSLENKEFILKLSAIKTTPIKIESLIYESYVVDEEIDGWQMIVRNCQDSLIIALGYTLSITIEKCSGCILIFGSCRGSVFMMEAANCWVLVACQQFRACDCRSITTSLHCSTNPTFENSDVEVLKLNLKYRGFERDFANSCLSLSINQWDKVVNFTPNSGSILIKKDNYDFTRLPSNIDPEVAKSLLSKCAKFINLSDILLTG